VHVSLAVHLAEGGHEVLEHHELDGARVAHVPEGLGLRAAGAHVRFPPLVEGALGEDEDAARLEGAVGRLRAATLR